jgi:hypothetical protein
VIDATDGDALARAAALAYAAETKSVVTFVAVTQFDVRSGPFHMHAFSETAYEEDDGAPVRRRILRAIDNGKVATPGDLVQRSAAPEEPTSRFGMRLPIYASAVGDYTYAKPRVDGDTVSVDFTAVVRDGAHGDGTLTLYRNEGRIATLVIRPCILPAHATSLTTTLEFGRVSEDRWDVVKITHAFTGKEGLLSGGGASVTTYERYRAFPSESAAEAALDAMEPASG